MIRMVLEGAEPLRVCRYCGDAAYTKEDLEHFVKRKKCLHGRERLCKACANLRHKTQNKEWRQRNEGYYLDWLRRSEGHSYIKKDGRGVARWHTVKDGRWRPRSCVIVEEILGRLLECGEVVHHINGDVLDDRPENLQLMKKSDHVRLHHRLRETVTSSVQRQP